MKMQPLHTEVFGEVAFQNAFLEFAGKVLGKNPNLNTFSKIKI